MVPNMQAKYDMIQGQLRIDKLAFLMKNIQGQSSGLKKYHKDSEASVKASYIIAQKIAVNRSRSLMVNL
jgi:hypothetical protein